MALFRNIFTDEVVELVPSMLAPTSSYGGPSWVDRLGTDYGPCRFGWPLGLEMIREPIGDESEATK
ncbi:MAG: hypothetical protein A2001_13930 [Treponema sp. GWC1_61_84]|nr:MAG: hypothetical protein A2001_13930 [Treponema sp. GWC1_61_84]